MIGNYEKASYKSKESRAALAAGPLKELFADEIEKVRNMQVQYLIVENPAEQYLLELYAAMELGTCLKEFDTH